MKKLNGGSSRRELKETNCEIETGELATFVTFKVKLSAVTLEWSKENFVWTATVCRLSGAVIAPALNWQFLVVYWPMFWYTFVI